MQFQGKAEGLMATYEPPTVLATGARSAIENLMDTGVTVNVDLTGLDAGTYLLEPTADAQLYPDISFQCDPVSVTLTKINPDNAGGEG